MIIKKMKNALTVIVFLGMLFFGEMFQYDVLAATKATTPMNEWKYAKKTANYEVKSTSKKYKDIWAAATDDDIDVPEIKNVKVKYSDKKIVITGKVKNAKKMVAEYNKEKNIVKIKSGKFKITLDYKNEKTIKLYGINAKGETITKVKKIASDRYVTGKVECVEMKHTKKGVTCKLNVEAGSILTIENGNKVIKTMPVDSSAESVFIPEKDLIDAHGKLTFKQKNTNKRTSKKVSYSIVEIGESMKVSY